MGGSPVPEGGNVPPAGQMYDGRPPQPGPGPEDRQGAPGHPKQPNPEETPLTPNNGKCTEIISNFI